MQAEVRTDLVVSLTSDSKKEIDWAVEVITQQIEFEKQMQQIQTDTDFS